MAEHIFKCASGAAVLCLTEIFGGRDTWLIALVVVVAIDYLTGLSKAYILGKLSSKTGFKGILKKMMYFAIVAVAAMVDNLLGATGILRMSVIGFLIANESLSILENCAAAGLPIPDVLLKALEKLKQEDYKKKSNQDK